METAIAEILKVYLQVFLRFKTGSRNSDVYSV